MIGGDAVYAVKIGDGARNSADAVITARAQAEARDGRLDQPRAGAIERAVPRQERWRQLGVRADAVVLIAIALPAAGRDDPLANAGRRFASRFGCEDVGRQRRDIY